MASDYSVLTMPREIEKERDKLKKKEKKRNKKDDLLEDHDTKDAKKRTKKMKKKEHKRSLHGSNMRPVRTEPRTSPTEKCTISSRISLPPMQTTTASSVVKTPSPRTSPREDSPRGFTLQKPPQLEVDSDSSDEELESICKRCETESQEPRANEPLRCPAPTPFSMWTGEIHKKPTSSSLRRAMEDLRMTSVLTRSISLPVMTIRRPIAVSARKSLQSGGPVPVPRLNLTNVYLVESCARLERLQVTGGEGVSESKPMFEITPRSAFTLTPRTPHTAHI